MFLSTAMTTFLVVRSKTNYLTLFPYPVSEKDNSIYLLEMLVRISVQHRM